MKKLLILISSILVFHIPACLGYEQTEDLSLQIKKEKLFFNDQYKGYIFELKNITDKPILIEEIQVKNTTTKENIKHEYNSSDKVSELCLSMIGFGIGEEPLKTPIIFAPVGIITLPFAIIHDGIKSKNISSNANKYQFKKQKNKILKNTQSLKFSAIKKTNSSNNIIIKISYKIIQQNKSTIFKI